MDTTTPCPDALFRELALRLFGLDLADHERRTGRPTVTVVFDCSDPGKPAILEVEGRHHDDLENALLASGIAPSVAGCCIRASATLGPDHDIDLLLVSQSLLVGPLPEYVGVLAHELCHFVVQSGIVPPFTPASRDYLERVARCTAWFDPDDGWQDPHHDKEWLAVMIEGAVRLAAHYPQLFPDETHAINASLAYDILWPVTTPPHPP